jgi:hypothetical protein
MRTLALPKEVEHCSWTTLGEKLVKIGAKMVRHGRYVTFQLAEWSSEHGQTTKIGPSDGDENTTIPMVAPSWYDPSGFGGYLGNVSSNGEEKGQSRADGGRNGCFGVL